MWRTSFVLVAALCAVGCDSGGGGDGAGGAGSARPIDSYLGTFPATFNAVSTFTAPAGLPPAAYTESGTITVTEKSPDTIVLNWTVGANPPSGTIEFKVDGAVPSATGGMPWMGHLSNGSVQTSWCDVCSLAVVGDLLTQTQQGHFTGVAANGAGYAGTYKGTWTGMRQR